MDLTKEEDVKNLFSGEMTFDYLINNAGVTLNCPLEDVTIEQFDQIMGTNVRGPFLMCKYALPVLRKSQVPTIIQLGSVVAHAGYADQSIYAASKHALSGMTKVLAKEGL